MNFKKFINSDYLKSNPLCGIDTYKDELNLATGACTRKIKKLVLKGTVDENITLYTVATGNLYRLELPALRILGQFYGNGICTHYRSVATAADRVNGTISGGNSAAVQGFVDIVDDYSTVADFKAYLAQQYAAGTPVTVWYVLAEPETETVTVPSGLSGIVEGSLTQTVTPTPTNPIYPTANTVEKWFDLNHYIMGTSTDTLTTLPAVVYANDTTATVGLKGNMYQAPGVSPDNPVMPQGTGDKTANLFTGQYSQFDNTGGTGTTYTYFKIDEDFTLSFKARNNLTVPQDYYVGISANGGNNSSGVTWALGSNNTISAGNLRTVKSSTNDYHCFSFYPKNETVFNWLVENFEIMLNTGETALPYEPFGVKIPISSANNTTPVYLGEVESTRRIRELVLTGQETGWQQAEASGGRSRFVINVSDAINADTSNPYSICSHLPLGASGATYSSDNVYTFASGKLYMRLTVDYDTLVAFKAYLAQQYANGTPVTVWYVLATEETGIVNEPLMKIGEYADALSNVSIPVTAGANTISVDTTLQPSEVTVNYKGWHPVADVHERDNGAWT